MVSRPTVVATLLRRILQVSPAAISKPDVRNEKSRPNLMEQLLNVQLSKA
jgi:hypothetical protein